MISFICSHVSRYYKTLFQREYKRINDRLLLSILHTPRFPHWNGKLKWKIDFFFHSAYSTLRIFYTPHFPHSAFSTLRIFYTPHFPHSAFSTLRTPHSALRIFHRTGNLPPFNSPRSLRHTALFGIISSPLSSRLTRYNWRHCSVLLRLISLASLGPFFFAIFASSLTFFPVQSFCLPLSSTFCCS